MHYSEAVSFIKDKLGAAEGKVLSAARGQIVTETMITYISDSLEESDRYLPDSTVMFGNLCVSFKDDAESAAVYSISAELSGEDIASEDALTGDAENFDSAVEKLCAKLAEADDAGAVINEELEGSKLEAERLISEMKSSCGRIALHGTVTAAIIALLFVLLIILSKFLK